MPELAGVDNLNRETILDSKKPTKKLIAKQGKQYLREAGLYFLKAIAVMACLMLVGNYAPRFPSVVIPLILIAYALISTIGALYQTVIRRIHKQYKLVKTGRLSRINRKWACMLIGYLVVFLFSAFFFVLEAPKWDALEWKLTWVAIPLYYIVFLIARHILKKEYVPKFYKAQAMRWSFWTVGVLLCLAYAILSPILSSIEYSSLSEAFQSTDKPYANSPSALMHDAGGLSYLTEGLASYGISQVAAASFILGFICRFVIYASVFFGLVNQFSFCLLNAKEIKSEFQILPAYDENIKCQESTGPIRGSYIGAIAAVMLITSVVFLGLEFEIAKARATQEHTMIERFVNEQTEIAISIVDKEYEWLKLKKKYAQEIEDLLSERDEALKPLIDEYYDRCLNNVDSYLDWYDSPASGFAKFLRTFGNSLVDDFAEKITEGTDDTDIQSKYGEYQGRLEELYTKVRNSDPVDELDILLEASSSQEASNKEDKAPSLELWKPLRNSGDASAVENILTNTDPKVDRDGFKNKVVELIEKAREDTFSDLKKDHGSAFDDDALPWYSPN